MAYNMCIITKFSLWLIPPLNTCSLPFRFHYQKFEIYSPFSHKFKTVSLLATHLTPVLKKFLHLIASHCKKVAIYFSVRLNP